jgi:hypothetical protein
VIFSYVECKSKTSENCATTIDWHVYHWQL